MEMHAMSSSMEGPAASLDLPEVGHGDGGVVLICSTKMEDESLLSQKKQGKEMACWIWEGTHANWIG
jgi:hypothetical protein